MQKHNKPIYLSKASAAVAKGFNHSNAIDHHLKKEGAPEPAAYYINGGQETPLYDPADIEAWNPRK